MEYGDRVIAVILIIAILASAEPQTATHKHSVTYIGGTVGMPVLLGITLETEIFGSTSTRIGFHAGSVIVFNSLGARIIRGGTGPGWKFRYFAGAVALFSNYPGKYGDPEGMSGHGWCGAGIDWNTDEWRLAIETGLLIGGSLERGLGFIGLTPTWGISLLHSI